MSHRWWVRNRFVVANINPCDLTFAFLQAKSPVHTIDSTVSNKLQRLHHSQTLTPIDIYRKSSLVYTYTKEYMIGHLSHLLRGYRHPFASKTIKWYPHRPTFSGWTKAPPHHGGGGAGGRGGRRSTRRSARGRKGRRGPKRVRKAVVVVLYCACGCCDHSL